YLRERSQTQLAVINIAAGAPRILQTGWFGYARVSPDGRFIATTRATSDDNTPDINLIDVQSGDETVVPILAPANKRFLAWTPDGQRLLYALDRRGSWDAWAIRLVDGKPQQQ